MERLLIKAAVTSRPVAAAMARPLWLPAVAAPAPVVAAPVYVAPAPPVYVAPPVYAPCARSTSRHHLNRLPIGREEVLTL